MGLNTPRSSKRDACPVTPIRSADHGRRRARHLACNVSREAGSFRGPEPEALVECPLFAPLLGDKRTSNAPRPAPPILNEDTTWVDARRPGVEVGSGQLSPRRRSYGIVSAPGSRVPERCRDEAARLHPHQPSPVRRRPGVGLLDAPPLAHADKFDVELINHKDYPFFERHEGAGLFARRAASGTGATTTCSRSRRCASCRRS